MKNEKFEIAIQSAKQTTAPGRFTWVWLMKTGRVESEHNKTPEQTKDARFFASWAKHVPNRIAEQVVIDSDGNCEFLIGGDNAKK